MHQTLYRKYRPTDFSEVVGQKIIVKTLENAINNNILSHAYLFTGPRGTGKTSIAKILAKTVNCMNLQGFLPCNECDSCTQINQNQSVDIIEIDAASNNGVDEIRELRSKISLVPSTAKYKVYIIDEVHMLTTGAFNALLKTLEEPPNHIIFILATTEPHKIPLTILSRCQRFDFKKIAPDEMKFRINDIVKKENVEIDELALNELIRLSDGCMRDVLSLLDQLLAYCDGNIKIDDIHEINGTITPFEIKQFLNNIYSNNHNDIFQMIDEFDKTGKNFVKLTEEIILYMRNLVLKLNVPEYFETLNLDKNIYDIENLKRNGLIEQIENLNKVILDMKNANNPRIIFELNVLKIIESLSSDNINVKKENKEETKKISREIIEKKEETINQNSEISINIKVDENIINKNINKIKKIRTNNTLCYFDKKYYLDIKNQLKSLSEFLLDPEYGEYVSIILDGELKAAGNNYLIFVYMNNRMTESFNNKLNHIDNVLEKIFNEKYYAISINMDEWNILKDEYNNKKRTFKYIEEPPNILEQKKEKENFNEIEQSFNDIIEYS